ncbi:hypothetical protein [Xanthovirga aplysinae]|uniref:hypothetical protein n=1 Tax=Xanthovirga aplysinae TaxID=2529853 RepID=UPI0012BBF881|nr:hypothetical protein [Xanthovirga aplysinae]MTI29921.1 hypothetical protein [Xanthovirga aplysinae]
MKNLILIMIFGLLTSCGDHKKEKNRNKDLTQKENFKKTIVSIKQRNNQSEPEVESKNHVNYQEQELKYEFKSAKLFHLTDTIIADFNGDGALDKAIFKREHETSGIIIMEGKTDDEVKIGFGEKFAHLTEFNWVDYWGLVKDSSTYEVLIEDAIIIGDTIIRLDNPSIVVRKEEVGGGIITYKEGTYKWLHQSD